MLDLTETYLLFYKEEQSAEPREHEAKFIAGRRSEDSIKQKFAL